MGYFYLTITILATVCSQLIIKWRVSEKIVLMVFPSAWSKRVIFLFKVLSDPFIFVALCLTFISGLAWMATMTKFEISYAYPFTMLGFVLVLMLSALLLGESFNIYKIIGCIIIIVGVFVTSKGL